MAQLYFPEEDEPRGLPAPAAKACCHGNNLFARQALLSGPGDGKDRSESQGFEVACLQHSLELHKYKAGAVPSKFSLERSWSLNDPKSLHLPPWQSLQEPRLCARLLPRLSPREDGG